MFLSMDKFVSICYNGFTLVVLLMFTILTCDVHLIVADGCVAGECKTTMATCQCPSESPPCSVVGLAIANVLVVTPLLIVYLFFPICCCFYSCRKRSDDMDKPPQIELAPPQFLRSDPRFRRTTSNSIETYHSDDAKHGDEDVFDEDNGKDNKNKDTKGIRFAGLSEDQRSLDNNSLIGYEETN